MDVRNREFALYGRFSPGARDRLQTRIVRAGGRVARDLTRRSDVLVIGALAMGLIDSGALAAKIGAARSRGIPVQAERAFEAALAGDDGHGQAALPLSTVLAQTSMTHEDAEILAAFDLIVLAGGACRFGDAGVLRTADDLRGSGRSYAEVVRILTQARDLAPRGRRRIVTTPSGEAVLQWEDGLTSLEGQGRLPLDEDHATLDDLFEVAAIAEADGEADEAARFYDMCRRADRRDPIAPYNLGNIRLAQGAHGQAILAYQQALARDAGFVEARYNLALALEAAGKMEGAEAALRAVVHADATHADAVFNLAQLRMKAGDVGGAKTLYEHYLALDPPDDWAATARKALTYCAAMRT
jgi:tetratricopeptide (TPR) repeat protein